MNVGEWPARWAKRYPEEPCLKYQQLELTKGEFNARVNRLAHAFQEMGLRKGERVGALMGNSHVFLEILFALSKIGGIMVPLNFRLAAPELEYILGDSEPVMLIYSPEFLQTAEALRGKVPTIKRLENVWEPIRRGSVADGSASIGLSSSNERDDLQPVAFGQPMLGMPVARD